ncbi:head-tail adaptor protein [uncultured Jannaschia sp.]|uniref:head-tail adaptor protein n=1 Tax=uncultured Jannaschia sp. TaxID=293347 RepID=UPI00341A722E
MTGRAFDRRLTLQTSRRTADDAGGFGREWVEQGAFWGNVKMRSGDLKHTEFGRMRRLRVRIGTHAIPDGHPMRPAPGDRLIDGRRTYEIQAVHDDNRHSLVILAEEVPPGETV